MLIKLCILFGGFFSFKACQLFSGYNISCPKIPHLETLPLCRYVCCGRDTWCNPLRFEMFLLSMINSLLKSVRCLAKNCKGATLLPPSDVYVRSFLLSLLYFNKTWLHKNSKWSGLISGSTSKSFPLEAKNPGIVHG